MANRDIIVVGASAGGVEALVTLSKDLPGDLPATVFVVLHLPGTSKSVLPAILTRRGALPAAHAQHMGAIDRGRIYVAPPDYHLVVQPGRMELDHGVKENGHRPSVDLLFRSAAQAYGPRVIGVILSGTLDDGAEGLNVVAEHGGAAVVQDPDDAIYGEMPANAIESTPGARVLPLAEIGAYLAMLTSTDINTKEALVRAEKKKVGRGNGAGGPPAGAESETMVQPDYASLLFSCPACGGPLHQVEEGPVPRFRCMVGHVYSEGSLLAGHHDGLEDTLWAAYRALVEKAELLRRMADRAERARRSSSAERFRSQEYATRQRITVVRSVLDHEERGGAGQ